MREETSDAGVEVRGIERRTNGDDEEHVLEVLVPTANPQSRSRDTKLDADGDALVGEIPVTNAQFPEVERRLNAEFVTALEEHIRTYYPMDDSWLVLLSWDAGTDEWEIERRELETYSFEPEDVKLFEEESVIWQRVDDETAI